MAALAPCMHGTTGVPPGLPSAASGGTHGLTAGSSAACGTGWDKKWLWLCAWLRALAGAKGDAPPSVPPPSRASAAAPSEPGAPAATVEATWLGSMAMNRRRWKSVRTMVPHTCRL